MPPFRDSDSETSSPSQLIESDLGLVEMIDQTFAQVSIILQEPLQAGLFEHDTVVNALRATAPLPSLGMLADRIVVSLGSAGQGGQQVVRNATHIELIETAADSGIEIGCESAIPQAHFKASVHIQITHLMIDARSTLVVAEQMILGGNEM